MKDVPAYELISAYFDGELSDDARAEAERLLVENVEYRRWFQELKAMRGAIAALPSHFLEADFAQKVLRRAELATLQGEGTNGTDTNQGSPPASDQPRQSVTPPESAAGPGGSSVQGTGAATRNGRSSVRWDAPLWIAVAASVCIYISLAGRESADHSTADQVAMQRHAEHPPMANPPAEAPAFGRAAPVFAPYDEAQTASGAVLHQDEKLKLEKRPLHERATLGVESVPAMESVPPGYSAPPAAKAAESADNEASLFRIESRMRGPASGRESAMPTDRQTRIAPQAQPATVPHAPMAPPNQTDHAEALATPASAASSPVTNQAAASQAAGGVTTASAAPSDVLICETPGDAQKLITQFEAALTAESIMLTAPPEGQMDDNALAKRQSGQSAAEEREGLSQNNQRSLALGPAPEEVRVYVVEASDEQLARLLTRLQQLPDTSLRQSQLSATVTASPSATFAAPLQVAAGDTDGTSAATADTPAAAGALPGSPPASHNFARPAINGVDVDQTVSAEQTEGLRSVNDARAKDAQAPGPTSRRAVFILRAPREAP